MYLNASYKSVKNEKMNLYYTTISARMLYFEACRRALLSITNIPYEHNGVVYELTKSGVTADGVCVLMSKHIIALFFCGDYLCTLKWYGSNTLVFIARDFSSAEASTFVGCKVVGVEFFVANYVIVDNGVIMGNNHVTFDGEQFVITPTEDAGYKIVQDYVCSKSPSLLIAYTDMFFLFIHDGLFFSEDVKTHEITELEEIPMLVSTRLRFSD